MNRRQFIGSLAAAPLLWPRHAVGAAFPVHFRRTSPYQALARFIAPGSDEFAGEKAAMDTAAALRKANPEGRYYVLPDGVLRYEVKQGLEYRVGLRKATGEPIAETVARAPRPLFRDITAELFGSCDSFREQMLRGIPYWRARLDSASGIDIYGNNGIAVGDIDNDGVDEVYVCQPGGLPNRIYKLRDGRMIDITEHAGVGLLDDTSCALFVDLRNSGHQDLVVLRAAGPLLYLNHGDGRFALRPDAFHFRAAAQGSFTGMSAADYDRDGRVDLYLCTYTYFQSEDQYRYPVPYHDARNGPPNFLFHNRLAPDGSGTFEDVTEASGLNENNDRYSFAPAWCDYDGDGWPDLYVANDFGRNNLYKNGGGRFRRCRARGGRGGHRPRHERRLVRLRRRRPPRPLRHQHVDRCRPACDARPGLPARARPFLARGLPPPHQRQFALPQPRRRHLRGDAAEAEMGRWAWCADAHDFDYDGTPGNLHHLRHAHQPRRNRPDELLLAPSRREIAHHARALRRVRERLERHQPAHPRGL